VFKADLGGFYYCVWDEIFSYDVDLPILKFEFRLRRVCAWDTGIFLFSVKLNWVSRTFENWTGLSSDTKMSGYSDSLGSLALYWNIVTLCGLKMSFSTSGKTFIECANFELFIVALKSTWFSLVLSSINSIDLLFWS